MSMDMERIHSHDDHGHNNAHGQDNGDDAGLEMLEWMPGLVKTHLLENQIGCPECLQECHEVYISALEGNLDCVVIDC